MAVQASTMERSRGDREQERINSATLMRQRRNIAWMMAWTLIGWSLAVILGFAGILELTAGKKLTGLLWLASAVIALPPVAPLVRRQSNIILPWWLGAVGVVILVLAGAAIQPSSDPSTPAPVDGHLTGTNAPAAVHTAAVKPVFMPDPRGVAMAKLLLLDDFNGYLNGAKTLGADEWSKLFPLGERITSRQLYASYNDNEVSADQRFKGKPLVISGKIFKISKDFTDSVYLMLDGDAIFGGVQAFLAPESARSAGILTRGAAVTLICQGSGMVLTFPQLKDCQTSQTVFASQRPVIEHIEEEFFAGGGAELSEKLRFSLGFAYLAGITAPPGNACEAAEAGKMGTCTAVLSGTFKNNKEKFESEYTALAKEVSLPPLPAPKRADEEHNKGH